MSSTFSFNPHESESEIAFLKRLFDFAKTQDENCIPAIVEEIDSDSGDVTVKPLVKRAMYSGDEVVYEDRPSLKVPVAQMRHGGFFISFPVSVGDTGWLFAGDRDWYTAREKNSAEDSADNEGAQNPDSLGKRQFIYGFFMPDSWAERKDADDSLKIGTTGDAKAYISVLKDGTVQIASGDKTATFDGSGMTINGQVQSTNGERKATMDAADLKESNAKFREIFVVTGKDESKSTEGHAVLNMRRMRVLSDEGNDCGDTVDVVAKDGEDGVSVTNATARTPISSDGITTTPVTFAFSNGTTRTVNVVAHNGEDGDDGLYVISATTDTSYEQNGYTVTPVTFTLSDNVTTVGPVNILAKNGTDATPSVQSVNGTTTRKSEANGNDIIADPSTGAVVLYVNKNKIVLTSEDQAVGGAKTFTNVVTVGTDNYSRYGWGYVELYNRTPYIDFHFEKNSADYTSRIIEYALGKLKALASEVRVEKSTNSITLGANDGTGNVLLKLSRGYSEGELDDNLSGDVHASFYTTAENDPVGGTYPCLTLSVNSTLANGSYQSVLNHDYIKIHPSLSPTIIFGDSDGYVSVKVMLGYDLPASASDNRFATCKWVLSKIPTVPSGTITYVDDIKYNRDGSSYKLEQHKTTLNIATGATTDAGWSDICNTTPLSSAT